MTSSTLPSLTNKVQEEATIKLSSVSLLTIFLAYLQVGLTAFNMAILQKLKMLLIKNRWLSEEEMNEGLAMVQLYPGPIMVDFTA
jgi:chromate transporter